MRTCVSQWVAGPAMGGAVGGTGREAAMCLFECFILEVEACVRAC